LYILVDRFDIRHISPRVGETRDYIRGHSGGTLDLIGEPYIRFPVRAKVLLHCKMPRSGFETPSKLF
jgi:hypothetical protein